jgi:hypothetical protein
VHVNLFSRSTQYVCASSIIIRTHDIAAAVPRTLESAAASRSTPPLLFAAIVSKHQVIELEFACQIKESHYFGFEFPGAPVDLRLHISTISFLVSACKKLPL